MGRRTVPCRTYMWVSACTEAARSRDPEPVGWCEAVMADEWRLLLEHSHGRMCTAAAAAAAASGGGGMKGSGK